MPNRSRVYQRASKRHGRKKKVQKRVPATAYCGYKNTIIPKPKDIDDEYASITAQTATNLKAFRQLFGAHEETDDEFFGYYPKEIASIQSTCRKKSRKIMKEISNLQSTLITGTSEKSTLLPTSSHSIPVKSNSSHKITVSSDVKDSALPAAEKFLGFSETDSLKDSCFDKALKLFDTCKFHEIELRNDPSSLLRISRMIDEPKETKVLELNGYKGSIPGRTIVSGRKPKTATSTLTSDSTNDKDSSTSELQFSPMNLKEFVQTQAIAGEITVTPILQKSEVPLAVKVRCDSPILINCLRKT